MASQLNHQKLVEIQANLDTSGLDKMGADHPIFREYKNLDLTSHTMVYDGGLTMKLGDTKRVKALLVLLLEDCMMLLQKQVDFQYSRIQEQVDFQYPRIQKQVDFQYSRRIDKTRPQIFSHNKSRLMKKANNTSFHFLQKNMKNQLRRILLFLLQICNGDADGRNGQFDRPTSVRT